MEQTIFAYFEKENVEINRKEFSFQLNSHPDFPSLLSVVDTLNFFKLRTGSAKISWEKFELLPTRFLCYLKNPEGELQLSLVERREFDILKDGTVYSYDEIKEIWSGFILLSEQSEQIISTQDEKRNWMEVGAGLTALVILGFYVVQPPIGIISVLFLLMSSIGILFSLRSHQDLLKWENKLIKKICNPAKSGCDTVFKSHRWKILEKINLSDIAMVFFCSQFISLLVFKGLAGLEEFYLMQNVLLLLSVPVIILSLVYQKMVEKKWCRVCLGISSVLLIELAVISYFTFEQSSINMTVGSIVWLGFIFSVVTFFWIQLKKHLLSYRTLQEFKVKAFSFKRKYDLFKNSLIAKPALDLPPAKFVLGNSNQNLTINLVTNLHCTFCKSAHFVLEEILKDHSEVELNIIFNVSERTMTKDSEKLYSSLIQKYSRSKKEFQEALSDWFRDMDIKRWLSENQEDKTGDISPVLSADYEWCIENNLNFTPVVIINNYVFPEFYEVSDLPYFINELTNDSFFLKNEADSKFLVPNL